MKRYWRIQAPRDVTYVAAVVLAFVLKDKIAIELSLLHYLHAVRMGLMGIVALLAIMYGLVEVYAIFINRSIVQFAVGNMLPLPKRLWLAFLIWPSLNNLESKVMARFQAANAENISARRAKREEELDEEIRTLVEQLPSAQRDGWDNRWQQITDLSGLRKLARQLRAEVRPGATEQPLIDRRQKREVRAPKHERRASREDRDCSPAQRPVNEVRHIDLKSAAMARLQINHLVSTRCDAVMAQHILLGLMNLGNEVSLVLSNYMPADALARKVRTSHMLHGLQFDPRVFRTTISALRRDGIIYSKAKTDEEVYSLEAKPNSGKSKQAAEIIRMVNTIMQDVKAGRLVEWN